MKHFHPDDGVTVRSRPKARIRRADKRSERAVWRAEVRSALVR